MVWQDIIITIAVLLFSYALIPQIYHNAKKRKSDITIQTSLITSIGMYAIAITYFTMNLYFSSVICLITGMLWTTILVQRIVY